LEDTMATLIQSPTRVEASGNKPKLIEEFIGRVNSGGQDASVARMRSPAGWVEPGQTPEFDEYTLVLNGALRVETKTETFDVGAGQAVVAPKGEWVRYSSPAEGGADYVAICVPAFSPDTVHRDD
jgi:mannose-6-phosphate isomerase-like protein (cupin superfamily)